jgi:2-amino-4-hydroxy-6-hydroxymethyldihydropteridine diphosphokinase
MRAKKNERPCFSPPQELRANVGASGVPANRANQLDGTSPQNLPRMPDSVLAFIALGANLDDPSQQVKQAMHELGSLPKTRLISQSRLYRSLPDGYTDQPDFINAVACVATRLTPRSLLEHLLEIEHRHGRVRTFRNSPRTLDLDILLYNGLSLDEPGLHLPHPRMHERLFVLQPLAEIAPDIVIPGHGTASSRLKDRSALARPALLVNLRPTLAPNYCSKTPMTTPFCRSFTKIVIGMHWRPSYFS